MGIYDGLGFEEVNQSEGLTSISYAVTHSGTYIYGTEIDGTTVQGTTIAGTNMYALSTISGATLKTKNIVLAGSIVGGSVGSPWEFTTVSGTNILGTNISGTYIYGLQVKAGSLVGVTNITTPVFSGTTGIFTQISGGNAILAGSFTDANGTLKSVANNGVYGARIRAGSNALGADSGCWLSYGIEYTVYPTILLTNTKTEGALYVSGTPDLGSAFIAGKTASDTFNWLSIGV